MFHKIWINVYYLMYFCCISCQSTSIDLGGVLSGNRMAAVPLGRSVSKGIVDVEGVCATSGMACQNCTHAVTCVMLPGGYLKVPLQECSEGLTCNAHEGRCSSQPVPECLTTTQQYEHTCEQVGIFPDAYDCRKFHLCSPAEGFPDGRPADHRSALCPRHYGYNPQTAQCSIKLENGQCWEKPVPDCTYIGQSEALPSSPNHYYVCLVKEGLLYPQVFICPHGWYFWDGFCRPEPYVETITQQVSTTEEDRSTSSSEEKITDSGLGNTSVPPERTTIISSTTSRIDSFFSTMKAPTYAPDTFLADKFDLSNYETTDDVAPTNDEFNSFETGDMWQ